MKFYRPTPINLKDELLVRGWTHNAPSEDGWHWVWLNCGLPICLFWETEHRRWYSLCEWRWHESRWLVSPQLNWLDAVVPL